MRIATYTRISTDEEHQPFSLGAQSDRLQKDVASQGGWTLVSEFSDQISGASLERPHLQRALMEARASRFDLLLVYRVDRLARSVRGLAQILENLDAVGVAFRSATEPFDTSSPAGRMMVQMLGVFAEFERSTIIDRVIAGMERKATRGEWCGGQRPYGYVIDPSTSRLRVKEDEAAEVSLIFRRYVKDRLGTNAIATSLNKSGYRTRNGRPGATCPSSPSSAIAFTWGRSSFGASTMPRLTSTSSATPSSPLHMIYSPSAVATTRRAGPTPTTTSSPDSSCAPYAGSAMSVLLPMAATPVTSTTSATRARSTERAPALPTAYLPASSKKPLSKRSEPSSRISTSSRRPLPLLSNALARSAVRAETSGTTSRWS